MQGFVGVEPHNFSVSTTNASQDKNKPRNSATIPVNNAWGGTNANARAISTRAVPCASAPPVCTSTTSMQSIKHGGRDRSYQLFVPASACKKQVAQPQGVPLLIYLHCYGCSCQNSDEWTRQAQIRGVVLAESSSRGLAELSLRVHLPGMLVF